MANLRAPLPHFLNLPLPSIQPINQKSSNQSPIVFKMTLSADQFEELLRMDSEVEEGEEGGLRLEFDQNQINPTGGRLHLTPTRNLLLNQPRSGPIRTNKPEEIYHHNILPTNTSQSRSPLRGLFKIPIGTPVFALQPNPVEPINTTQPTPNQPSRDTLPITHTLLNQPDQVLNLNSNTQHSQREKEKLAGQKLKERRLEAERKKKEKQMVLLPTDTVPNGPKKGRPVKARESKQKSTASKWTSTHNSQPPAPSHIIQATVSNPVNGHSTRKAHLASHPEQATDQISNRSPNPTVFPLTKSLDTTPLLPPINTFSPSPQSAPRTRGTNASSTSNTNRRNKPPSLVEPNHSLLLTSQLSPEPFSATKLSATSTVLTSLSEESEADPRTLEQAPPVPERKQKPPNRRNNTSGSAKQSSSKTVPSNKRGIIKALPETPAASETQGSANFTTQSKKLSTGPAPVAVNGTASNLSHESSQPHVLPSKKRKQIEQTETPATGGEVGITRTKMAVRKDNLEKKVKPVVLGGVPSAQEAIGIKQSSNVKVKRAAENKAVRDAGVGAVENHRKRTLEVDAANGGTYPLTKRVKPEQASGLVAPGSMIVNPMGIGAIPTSLPTIRKVNRESEEVNSNSRATC
ncbi:hypothetical protein BY996DRAFT_2370480 [Phakopsora pachyrhizi]|nr:hypothetical protein BY996DRAFT_2370480 [Phakopsora pachyrhizi]